MVKPSTLTILVTGANGQLGRELRRLSRAYRRYDFRFTDLPDLDISNAKAVKSAFSSLHPGLLINCAAYTAVDLAETEQKTALRLNGTAVGLLARNCREADIPMVHISTDYIFGGKGNRPLTEESPVSPQSSYARSKLAGERAMQKSGVRGIILRTSWLYSEYGNNFVKTILNLTRTRNELNVVYDQVGTPTYAGDLAAAILKIVPAVLQIRKLEVYHYANEGVTSWYDFALAIAELKKIKSCRIRPIETKDFPKPAARPWFSVFNKEKFRTTFGLEIPHWRDSLKTCLSRIK